MLNNSQSSSSSCNYNITGGGSIQKQLDSLFSSSKKTLSSLTKSLVGTKKTVKRKSTTKKPVKRKSTTKKSLKRKFTTKKPVKRKSTTKKPVKHKSATKKPVKRKSTTKKPLKRKSTIKKPLKRKSTIKKGGTTSNSQRYYDNFKSNILGNSLNSKIKMMGGNASDFIGTVSSRGPINYPNSEGTGMTGEDLFRTFNKTGTYIPHHKANVAGALTDGILNRKLI